MKQFLPTLAAVGGACTLAAAPAVALELGELTVESKLGEPLRASIAYALQPHEQLSEFCVFLKPGIAASGLPNLARAKIAIRGDAILLTGSVPIREPMLGLQLSVNCPYTANLQREYTLFFDFGSRIAERTANPESGDSDRTTPQFGRAETGGSVRKVAATPASRTGILRGAIEPNSRYQVQPGDSLSDIAARIADRPRGLWPAVNAIFAANPDAFIDGDVNRIKAGSWLEIPDLYGTAASAASTPAPSASMQATPPDPVGVYGGYTKPADAVSTPFKSGFSASVEIADPSPRESADATGSGPSTAVDDVSGTDELRPGDIILGSNSPFVNSVESDQGTRRDIVRDVGLSPPSAGPQAATAADRGAATGSWYWLAWLGGAGLAVFAGLLLFGHRVRDRFGSIPIGAVSDAPVRRRREDAERQPEAAAEVDFSFDTVSNDSPSMFLDADLGLGTGLHGGSDMDVAQDFGFSTSTDFASDFDLEIPAGAVARPETQITDVIPPNRKAETSILESEIPPSDDDDEYDLSMIVDATRQPVVDTRLTAKDLKAVAVELADDDSKTDEFTLNRDSDYKILEQDYQEEFTTTQALNDEIARAALELAESMGKHADHLDETAEMPGELRAGRSSDITSELPARSETEITAELTAKLADHGNAVNDDLISDLDDTGVNEELTAELPRTDDDVTSEIDVEGGRINTKKTRAS